MLNLIMKDERLTVERLVSDNAHTFQDERKRLNISKSLEHVCIIVGTSTYSGMTGHYRSYSGIARKIVKSYEYMFFFL